MYFGVKIFYTKRLLIKIKDTTYILLKIPILFLKSLIANIKKNRLVIHNFTG